MGNPLSKPTNPESGQSIGSSEVDPFLPSREIKHNDSSQRAAQSFGFLAVSFVLYLSVVVSHQPILQQYLYFRLGDDQSGSNTTTQSFNTGSDVRCGGNTSTQAEIQTQKQVSTWIMLIGLGAMIPGILSTVVLGSYTDRKGRKIGLILPTFGTIITSIVMLLVIGLKLPIPILILGNVLQGLCGFFGTVLAASFAYVADITESGKDRTFRIAFLQSLAAVSVGLSNLVTGYFIKVVGYFYPMLIGAILLTVDFIFIWCLIPESITWRSNHGLTVFSSLTTTFKTYTKPRTGRKRFLLITILIVLILVEMVLLGRQQIAILYVLRSPFCWASVKIGLYSFMGVMISLKRLQKMLRPSWLIGLGLISILAELLLLALASTNVMIFLSAVVGLLSLFPAVIGKTTLSKAVNRDEQGSVFGGISIVQVLCTTLTLSVFNPIYQATVAFMPGFVYLVMAGMMGLAIITAITMGVFIEGRSPDHETRDPDDRCDS